MTTDVQRGLAAARQVLPNGAVILSKEAHTVPAVTIQVSVQAGSICDTNELLGLSHLASRVIDRGTLTRSSDEIAEALDARGASLSVSANRHVLTLTCTCLSEDFESMLELVGDILMQPSFPDEAVATRKGEVLNAIRQDEDNPAAMAMQALFAMLYPDAHPYGRPSKGRVETVSRITRPISLPSRRRASRLRRSSRSSWAMSIAIGRSAPGTGSSARGRRPRRVK